MRVFFDDASLLFWQAQYGKPTGTSQWWFQLSGDGRVRSVVCAGTFRAAKAKAIRTARAEGLHEVKLKGEV